MRQSSRSNQSLTRAAKGPTREGRLRRLRPPPDCFLARRQFRWASRRAEPRPRLQVLSGCPFQLRRRRPATDSTKEPRARSNLVSREVSGGKKTRNKRGESRSGACKTHARKGRMRRDPRPRNSHGASMNRILRGYARQSGRLCHEVSQSPDRKIALAGLSMYPPRIRETAVFSWIADRWRARSGT